MGLGSLRRLGLGLAVPQLEDVCNVIDFVQGPVEVRSCVTSRDAKASSGHENGHGGKANDHNREATLQALARKGSNLGRVVKHHGHDRRVELAQHIQTHLLEAHPKVIRIVAERLQLLFTNVGTVFSHDNLRRVEEERHVSEQVTINKNKVLSRLHGKKWQYSQPSTNTLIFVP
jgi:hypothetical protein